MDTQKAELINKVDRNKETKSDNTASEIECG